MKTTVWLAGVLAMSLWTASSWAAPLAMLTAGTYTAKVKAIICGACPPKIEETTRAVSGIASAKVDTGTGLLTFTVKKKAKVRLSTLQKALKAASEKMGMGADYELRDVRRLK